MDSNAQSLMQEGIRAIREQDMETGRRLLTESLRLDPRNDNAWVWLAQAESDPRKKRECIEQALKINPSNTQAQTLKARLSGTDFSLAPGDKGYSSAPVGFSGTSARASNTLVEDVVERPRSTIAHKMIRRANVWLLVRSLIGIALLTGAVILNANYLYNMFNGPFPAAASDINTSTDLSSLREYYLTVKGDDVIDTGYQYVETSSSGVKTVKNGYYALVLSDHLLLVKVSGAGTASNIYTGRLVPMPYEEQTNVIADIERDEPKAKGLFLPFMLDTGDFKITGYIGIAIGAIVGLLCLIGLIRVVRRSVDPHKHPIMRDLARFGDPDSMAAELDNELDLSDQQKGKIQLTNNWLVTGKGGSFKAMRLNDVAWMYKTITQRRVNGIPAGKSFSMNILDKHGKNIIIPAKEKDVNLMLVQIAQRTPWATMGYSTALAQSWKKDRAGFIQGVESRKTQFKGSSPSSGV